MGEVHVDITPNPIEIARALELVQEDASCGAIATFTGTTRCERDPEHGALIRLDYEAYDEMARAQMKALAAQAMKEWAVTQMVIVHRIGPVLPGEASVFIAVATGHRTEAFNACRWLIDTLKRDVPIWKKDVYEDGFVRWVEPEKRHDS